MTDSGVVGYEYAAGVSTITLARPPANALGEPVIAGLTAAFDRAESDRAAVVVIQSEVTGFFAAGADLTLFDDLDQSGFLDYLDRLRAQIERADTGPWVSIAAIDGHALGGGLELAMACTMRVASAEAKLGVPEVKLGLLPGAAGTQRLPKLIGRGPAIDLLLTGRSIDGAEAHRLGLVDRLAGPGTTAADAARELATSLAQGPRDAHQAILRCVETAARTQLAEGMQFERAEVAALFDTADGREGVRAFLAKRRPVFGAE
ncbi:MAG: enoyl-CoA hydratase-related protein [Actinomycetota bacterium]|nr:enoyl-CoA hydratase-related protein [Actinomycetota bacterium]